MPVTDGAARTRSSSDHVQCHGRRPGSRGPAARRWSTCSTASRHPDVACSRGRASPTSTTRRPSCARSATSTSWSAPADFDLAVAVPGGTGCHAPSTPSPAPAATGGSAKGSPSGPATASSSTCTGPSPLGRSASASTWTTCGVVADLRGGRPRRHALAASCGCSTPRSAPLLGDTVASWPTLRDIAQLALHPRARRRPLSGTLAQRPARPSLATAVAMAWHGSRSLTCRPSRPGPSATGRRAGAPRPRALPGAPRQRDGTRARQPGAAVPIERARGSCGRLGRPNPRSPRLSGTKPPAATADAVSELHSARQPMSSRVLWLTKGLGRGGAERLLRRCRPPGRGAVLDVEVAYLLPRKNAFVDRLAERRRAVHCLQAAPRLRPRWVLRLRRLLADGGYDTRAHPRPLSAAAARLVAPRGPVKLVHTEHNIWDRYRRRRTGPNALTYRPQRAVIAVSRAVADSDPAQFRSRRCGADPVEVILHGIDLDSSAPGPRRAPSARAALGLPRRVPVARHRRQPDRQEGPPGTCSGPSPASAASMPDARLCVDRQRAARAAAAQRWVREAGLEDAVTAPRHAGRRARPASRPSTSSCSQPRDSRASRSPWWRRWPPGSRPSRPGSAGSRRCSQGPGPDSMVPPADPGRAGRGDWPGPRRRRAAEPTAPTPSPGALVDFGIRGPTARVASTTWCSAQ